MQPKPIPNDSQPIAEMVIADIRERMEQGRAKYGVELQAHNGRKALQDAYEEVLDLAQYLKQEMVERDALAWLDQREREAAEAERRANTDTVRAMGPHFCDFFFGAPGEEKALQDALAAACREAAAAVLAEAHKDICQFAVQHEYGTALVWTWSDAATLCFDRSAALRAGKGVQDA